MATKLLFIDDSESGKSEYELEAFKNTEGRLFLDLTDKEDPYVGGWITLDKETALELANHIIKEMTNG